MSPDRAHGAVSAGSRVAASVRGRLFFHPASTTAGFGAFIYLPISQPRPGTTTLLVHGITRNAVEQVARFAPIAERLGTALIAPLFTRALFPRYQTLAAKTSRPDPVVAFDALLDDLMRVFELDMGALRAFGFSGGGQFLHRYAMMRPQRFARIAIGAAGWYTFPDTSVAYPYGVCDWPSWTPSAAAHFLALPMRVLVGSRDNRRDPALNRDAAVDRQQGRNRVERGKRWVAAVRACAEAHGVAHAASFRRLQGVSHNFTDAVIEHRYGERVFGFLFPGELGDEA